MPPTAGTYRFVEHADVEDYQSGFHNGRIAETNARREKRKELKLANSNRNAARVNGAVFVNAHQPALPSPIPEVETQLAGSAEQLVRQNAQPAVPHQSSGHTLVARQQNQWPSVLSPNGSTPPNHHRQESGQRYAQSSWPSTSMARVSSAPARHFNPGPSQQGPPQWATMAVSSSAPGGHSHESGLQYAPWPSTSSEPLLSAQDVNQNAAFQGTSNVTVPSGVVDDIPRASMITTQPEEQHQWYNNGYSAAGPGTTSQVMPAA